mmetsp:Transcript_39852/g.43169  ORF Transcript_39852/g.43169 Transcript_39852/m.43169 type:complete len:143 (-) Transcript_39852:1721-2149(-)
MSAVADKSIHIDGLCILLRKDPEAALLRLQQKPLLHVGDRGQTVTVTGAGIGTYTDTANNNNNSDDASINNTDSTATSCVFNFMLLSTAPSSSSGPIAAAVLSTNITTTTDKNNTNDDDDNRDNVTHQLSSPKGKKRKHDLV